MATTQEFIDYVSQQLKSVKDLHVAKMFGEYGMHVSGTFIGLICDNQFYLKPTAPGRAFIGEVESAPPYPGAKPSFLLTSKLAEPEWLCELINITVQALPKKKG